MPIDKPNIVSAIRLIDYDDWSSLWLQLHEALCLLHDSVKAILLHVHIVIGLYVEQSSLDFTLGVLRIGRLLC